MTSLAPTVPNEVLKKAMFANTGGIARQMSHEVLTQAMFGRTGAISRLAMQRVASDSFGVSTLAAALVKQQLDSASMARLGEAVSESLGMQAQQLATAFGKTSLSAFAPTFPREFAPDFSEAVASIGKSLAALPKIETELTRVRPVMARAAEAREPVVEPGVATEGWSLSLTERRELVVVVLGVLMVTLSKAGFTQAAQDVGFVIAWYTLCCFVQGLYEHRARKL